MDRYASNIVEEDVVAALPLCVRRLRGPGRARRQPPGAVYRSAGAVLHRVLLYSEDGRARVQVMRSDGLTTSQEKPLNRLAPSATPLPATSGGNSNTSGVLTASPAAASPAPQSGPAALGLMSEAREEGINTRRSTHLSNQDTTVVHTRSQLRRERATTLAAETERRFKEAQESALAGLLQALPLLRVVPPLSLLQQQYTPELAPAPSMLPPALSVLGAAATAAQGRHAGSPAPPGTAAAATTIATAGGITSGSAKGSYSTHAALCAAQARYQGVTTHHDPDRRSSAEGSSSVDRAGAWDGRRLGLSSAVLLTRAETEDALSSSAVAVAAGTDADAVHDAGSPPPPPPATSSPPLLATRSATASSVPSTSCDGDASAATAAGDADDAAGAAAALNSTYIDGGLGVTIRIGASCDEPNSLRYVAWGGCRPLLLRAVVWRLLSDYAAVQVSRQQAELQRKRRQYGGYTKQYCSALTMLSVGAPASSGNIAAGGGVSPSASTSLSRLPAPGQPSLFKTTSLRDGVGGGRGMHGSGNRGAAGPGPTASTLAPHEQAIVHQMLLDLPRHQSPIFHARLSVAGMTRCLFLWSQRHPAVGYVQGMDDVVAIFYQVFLTDALRQHARERLARQRRSLTPSPSSADTFATAAAAVDSGAAAAAVASSVGDDTQGGFREEGSGDADGGGERSTRAIMRLLLVSLDPRRPSTTSVPSTPNVPLPAGEQKSRTAFTLPSAAATTDTNGKPVSAASATTTTTTTTTTYFPFLTEADVDVVYATPAALDAALSELPESYLTQVEADTFYCAGRVLSFLQDNFMAGQPGILRSVRRLEALLRVVDPAVVAFLDDYGLTVMDGCFQWLHCLLARELPLSLVLRLWDCYLAIGVGEDRPASGQKSAGVGGATAGGSSGGGGNAASSDEAIMYFHVCVCCALLRALRTSLMGPAAPAGLQGVTSGAPSAAAATVSTTASSTVGGWASALVTALPGFRARPASGAAAESAAATRAKTPIDVVMTTMKRPFEALFPNYPTAAARQRRVAEALRHGERSALGAAAAATAAPPLAADSQEEAAAERWLDLLIADAYCIWRLHPLTA